METRNDQKDFLTATLLSWTVVNQCARQPTYRTLEDRASIPLGVVFAVLALLNLMSGARVYWHGMRGLRDGMGFVGADM